MKFSPGITLEIDDRKIVDYLLDLQHPDGKSKAAFFRENGIIDGKSLEILLRQQASTEEIKREIQTPFGKKYIIESSLSFPNGKSHLIRSVWILNSPENVAKFVTAYKITS